MHSTWGKTSNAKGLLSVSSPLTPANVTTTQARNIYLYQPRNLLLTYGLAIFFAFLAICLGLFAYFSNGVSHDISFSTIFCTTRGIHFSSLNAHEKLGALPLDKRIARTMLRFYIPSEAAREANSCGLWGFGLAWAGIWTEKVCLPAMWVLRCVVPMKLVGCIQGRLGAHYSL